MTAGVEDYVHARCRPGAAFDDFSDPAVLDNQTAARPFGEASKRVADPLPHLRLVPS